MTTQDVDRAYLSRFEALAVAIDGKTVMESELSQLGDRTRRAAIEGVPVAPKTWEPQSSELDWHAKLSGDEPFVSKQGHVITPPKGGFYALWRKRFAGWQGCTP